MASNRVVPQMHPEWAKELAAQDSQVDREKFNAHVESHRRFDADEATRGAQEARALYCQGCGCLEGASHRLNANGEVDCPIGKIVLRAPSNCRGCENERLHPYVFHSCGFDGTPKALSMFGPGFPPEPDAAPVEPLTTHALWEWLMAHGATDWHTTATRLTHTFHIIPKETQP